MLTHKYGLISRESCTRGYGEGKERRILPPRPARGERIEVRGTRLIPFRELGLSVRLISGLRCSSGARRIPHLNPLPLPKGEAI